MANLNFILSNLQTKLVSGTNIKTVNGNSILGSGNLVIASGIAIGDTVTNGTEGSVLFLGASGALAQDNTYLRYISGGVLELGTTVANPSYGDRLKIRGSTNDDKANIWVEALSGYLCFAVKNNGTIQIGNNQDIIGSSANTGYFAFSTNASGFSFNKKLAIGFNGIGSASLLHVKANSATDIVSIFQGTTAQSGNLTEWRNVSDTVLASVDKDGKMDAVGYKVGGTAGFTGTGDYNSFTIVGGIITNAVEV